MKDYIDGEINKKELEDIIDPNKEYIIFQKDVYDEIERLQTNLKILCYLGGFFTGILISACGYILFME